ncbi:hypothetical protein SLE2022_080960 [Rubroshorea leprosula]
MCLRAADYLRILNINWWRKDQVPRWDDNMRASNLARGLFKCSPRIAARLKMIEESKVGDRPSSSKVKVLFPMMEIMINPRLF